MRWRINKGSNDGDAVGKTPQSLGCSIVQIVDIIVIVKGTIRQYFD
jgi:hypothetical protein